MNADDDHDPALDRLGHLSTWALDRLRLDDPASDPPFFAAAERHLATCEACRAARDATEAEVAALPALLPPRAARRTTTRAWWLGAGGAIVAAAAVALVVARAPPDPGTGIVAKGTRFDFEVHVNDGRTTTLASDGALVAPGARLGFRARAAEAGHVLVWGWDDRLAPYPVHPADGSQRAAPIGASASPEQLPAAIALDDVGAAEHLAAVWCEGPFSLAELDVGAVVEIARVEAAVAARGCSLRVVHLRKAGRR